jgi:hypothetical protein|tara:strand:- start:189 stop:410 length:222 start_codon:yes stop_codon:yes gene_type:complete
VRDVLHRHYPNTLLVFDTVDLHFLREAARATFVAAHRNDTALLSAVFGASLLKQHGNASEQARGTRESEPKGC